MTPELLNITSETFTTFEYTKEFVQDELPVDLTSYTAKMQVRTTPFTDTVLLELTELDGITLTSGGELSIKFTSDKIINGQYDVLLTDVANQTTYKVLYGTFRVNPTVTKLI